MIKRYTLMKLHMILASLVLPITIMFFITGVLYIFDIEPESAKQEFRIEYARPLQPDVERLLALARKELAVRGISEPLGEAKLEWDSDLEIFYLDWDGSNHWLKLRPSTRNMHVAVLKIYTPS